MYRSRKTTKAYNPWINKKPGQGSTCPFCHLDDRRVHTDTAHMRVVDNSFPYELWDKHKVVEHLLLLPKRHVESLSELTDVEKVEAMNLMAEYEAAGYSVYWRAKSNVQRTVLHQHTHLIKTSGPPLRFSIYSEKPYFLWKV